MIEDYFDKQVEFRKVVNTPTSLGGNSKIPTTHLTLMGRIVILSGKELVQANQLSSKTTHRLYCPHDNTIDVKDNIICNGVQYEITFIDDPMDFHEFMQIDLVMK